ncbi:MAG TPA: polyphosphate kinase 2 family protein [Bacteroidales bacterium]|nr:polyphosphate kinase 2 family protein [Bacteroidales bacterium]
MNISEFEIKEGSKVKLAGIQTDNTGKFDSKEESLSLLEKNIDLMAEMQDKLYAQNKYSLLIILQAMDTAGKDGIIKHVMHGLNPQGTYVQSFKRPSEEELDHDYLWRINRHLPERGRIGIFNRSYYEEVLVVKVHDMIRYEQLPDECVTTDLWQNRYRQMREYERYLRENGTVVVKIFLHISKDEQKERLLKRIEDTSKNWKFSAGDIEERKYWNEYQRCYEEAIENTTGKHAPWYVVPADKKWYARLVVSEIIIQTLQSMKIGYPELSKDQLAVLEECRQKLMQE